MPIYYGYGCGVMNEPAWASPKTTSFWMDDIDNAISYLKSVPHPWKPFKKSPSGISKTTPWYHARDKKSRKILRKEVKTFLNEVRIYFCTNLLIYNLLVAFLNLQSGVFTPAKLDIVYNDFPPQRLARRRQPHARYSLWTITDTSHPVINQQSLDETDDWAKSLGKLLDARMCIDAKGGTTVTAASIEKMCKLSQYRPKPSESGGETYYEKYLP